MSLTSVAARHRRAVLALGLVVLIALAGCAGNGTTTASPTDAGPGETTAAPADTTRVETTAAPGDTTRVETTDTTETTDATETMAVSADQVRSDLLAAISEVETFRAVDSKNLTRESNNIERSAHIRYENYVNRTAEQVWQNQTVSQAGTTSHADVYLFGDTFYTRSPINARQYGSEWVARNVSGNVSTIFDRYDVADQLHDLLPNATLALDGTRTIDGTEAFVLETDIAGEAFEEYNFGRDRPGVEMENVSMTLFVATDSNRPVRIDAAGSYTATSQGQTMTVTFDTTSHIYYEDVSITLPAAAEGALNLSASG